MALGRVYTIDSGLVTVATTTQTCILVGTTTAVQTFYVEALRIGIHSGAGVSYPANGSVMAQMLRSTGTATGGGTATKNPANTGDVAAQSAWLSGSTAIAGLTATAVEPWGQELPFTAGSNWGEWWTPGAEVQCPISSNLALWVTCSSAGTATQFKAQLVISE